ncbi:12447_t:CDS:2 [Funneliformis geosporum]|uniref:12447_t:CDS:1 n=1 Tax=Funneliformis geosporum TaxID=1117311 RepID=A0A9W4SB66_9GLOM|nr:12447_t:CDS:2 [Funneliformis geosporum]
MNTEEIIKNNNLDALFFFSPENRFWLTDFQSSLGFLFIIGKEKYLLVDGRYITDAQKKLNHKQVEIRLWKIGIETNKIRMVKTKKEITRMSQAAQITDRVYQRVLKLVKIGMSEKDLAKLIHSSFEEMGAEGLSFDTIVVSGKNGALPHGQPSDKIIKEGELITVDFGCKYQGYCSDFTRTFAVGKEINPKLKEIYQIVKEAHEIDQIVRNYIQQKGFGEYFIHSTGHGLGIEVHEAPSVSSRDNTILQPGMVITIEPGIYIPDLGGVRIEDDVLVTKTGYQQYYQVLGLTYGGTYTKKDIENAYKRQSLRYHSDKVVQCGNIRPGSLAHGCAKSFNDEYWFCSEKHKKMFNEAEERMKEINQAYCALTGKGLTNLNVSKEHSIEKKQNIFDFALKSAMVDYLRGTGYAFCSPACQQKAQKGGNGGNQPKCFQCNREFWQKNKEGGINSFYPPEAENKRFCSSKSITIQNETEKKNIESIKLTLLEDVRKKRIAKSGEKNIRALLELAKSKHDFEELLLIIKQLEELRETEGYQACQAEIQAQEERLKKMDPQKYNERINSSFEEQIKSSGLTEGELSAETIATMAEAKRTNEPQKVKLAKDLIAVDGSLKSLNQLLSQVNQAQTKPEKQKILSKLLIFIKENIFNEKAYQKKRDEVDRVVNKLAEEVRTEPPSSEDFPYLPICLGLMFILVVGISILLI